MKADGETVTVGFIKLQLRLRTALEAQPDASPPKAAPKAATKAPAAAAEEEDDSDFANAIVSYNVLEWELGRLNEQVGEIQAKGLTVTLTLTLIPTVPLILTRWRRCRPRVRSCPSPTAPVKRRSSFGGTSCRYRCRPNPSPNPLTLTFTLTVTLI